MQDTMKNLSQIFNSENDIGKSTKEGAKPQTCRDRGASTGQIWAKLPTNGMLMQMVGIFACHIDLLERCHGWGPSKARTLVASELMSMLMRIHPD